MMIYISLALSACGATHPLHKACVDTTPPGSAARWTCLNQANAEIHRNSPKEKFLAPYDPLAVPSAGNLTPGMTQGNSNYELQGTYKPQPSRNMNCTSIVNGNVISTNCQ